MSTKIVKHSIKAAKSRERSKQYRKRKRNKEQYESEVQARIDVRKCENVDELGSTENSLEQKLELFEVAEELRLWAIKHHITHAAINDLMAILILAGLTFLPRNSKTLMKTPTQVDIVPLGNGKMWYFGIGVWLQKLLANCKRDITIHLDFNFDGQPLFNSSTFQFWPILSTIRGNFNRHSFINSND